MSFKLVDNKGSADNKLHSRRRADDLLLDGIPPTEYIVSRSGKYCCKVCPQWPVFDTPGMLKNHREGIKHMRNSEDLERANLRKALNEPAYGTSCSSIDVLDCNGLGLENVNYSCRPACDRPSPMEKHFSESIHSLKRPTEDGMDFKFTKKKRWTPFFQTKHETPAQKRIKMAEVFKVENAITKKKETCPKGVIENNKACKVVSDNSKNVDRKNQRNAKCPDKVTGNDTQSRQGNPARDNVELKMRYYAKMKQNGWILDPNGKWTKNEECEFDSDDEPPKYDEFEKWNK